MKICECFLSIDGEGKRTGQPTVFLRKFGCNLRCSYCDTSYAFNSANTLDMSPDEIVKQVNEVAKGCKELTFTGGEPLFYNSFHEELEAMELLTKLVQQKYHINVETNGAINLNPWQRFVQPFGFFTMDWKCPSSGMNKKMLSNNLHVLTPTDVLKFVVGNDDDLREVLNVLNTCKPAAQVYISPVFGKIEPSKLVNFVLDNRLYNTKVQVQLHKILWDPETKGV